MSTVLRFKRLHIFSKVVTGPAHLSVRVKLKQLRPQEQSINLRVKKN